MAKIKVTTRARLIWWITMLIVVFPLSSFAVIYVQEKASEFFTERSIDVRFIDQPSVTKPIYEKGETVDYSFKRESFGDWDTKGFYDLIRIEDDSRDQVAGRTGTFVVNKGTFTITSQFEIPEDAPSGKYYIDILWVYDNKGVNKEIKLKTDNFIIK